MFVSKGRLTQVSEEEGGRKVNGVDGKVRDGEGCEWQR